MKVLWDNIRKCSEIVIEIIQGAIFFPGTFRTFEKLRTSAGCGDVYL